MSTPGAGNGLSQKEWNARFDGKMDNLVAQVQTLQIIMASHEAKAMHAGTKEYLDDIHNELDNTRTLVLKGVGVCAALVFFVPLVVALVRFL